MTPIFFNSLQYTDFDFPSYKKVPKFIRQAARPLYSDFEGLRNVDFIAAHSVKYVAKIFLGEVKNGFGNSDSALNETLRFTNGGFVAATKHALERKDPVVCSATQGFHHAGFDFSGGYCTFNGLMIAALGAPEGVKTLIIDGDAHYGNGTADIIEALQVHSRVHHTGSNQMYPFVKMHKPKARDWSTWTSSLISAFSPSIIMYQAGADAWIEDPYGSGYLTLEGLRERDLGIFRAAQAHGIPIVWNLAGGYCGDIQKTVDVHLQTLKASDEVFYAKSR